MDRSLAVAQRVGTEKIYDEKILEICKSKIYVPRAADPGNIYIYIYIFMVVFFYRVREFLFIYV